jgi:DnaD/phage-associated family protein
MDYILNPAAYGAMFAVPAEVVDKHLRLAGAAQLKALLWLLRHGGVGDTVELAKALGLAPADASDALQYWLEMGLIISSGESLNPVTAAAPAQNQPQTQAQTEKEKTPKPFIPPQRPTRGEVARRGSESPEIAFLIKEAELKLGRLISFSEAAALVWLFDYESLPACVILMLVEYCVSENKFGVRYMEKLGADWAAKEINTVERAERHLTELSLRKTAWRKIENAFGLEHRQPSEKELEFASRWVNEYLFTKAMLKAAYDRCVDSTAKINFKYIDKILVKWYSLKITAPEDIPAAQTKEKSPQSGKSQTSYDLGIFDVISIGGKGN